MDNHQFDFDLMRQQMVAEVVAETAFLTPRLGKAALNAQVVAAMTTIAGHEFVPLEIQPEPISTRCCRLAMARPSPSLSSLRS